MGGGGAVVLDLGAASGSRCRGGLATPVEDDDDGEGEMIEGAELAVIEGWRAALEPGAGELLGTEDDGLGSEDCFEEA